MTQTFSTYQNFNSHVAQTVKGLGIASRTNRIRAEVRLSEIAPAKVQMIYRAIEWALATGRLHAQAEENARAYLVE